MVKYFWNRCFLEFSDREDLKNFMQGLFQFVGFF